jgi:hypothetical protein
VFQEKVEDNDSACRKYIGHDSSVCGFCGSLMPGKGEIVIMEDGSTVLSCPKCAERIGTCATCAQARACDFETNPIQIPKQVQKVIRQGNMQMQTVIRNPEREKETCMKGCSCWDEENCICLREAGMCKSWRRPNA